MPSHTLTSSLPSAPLPLNICFSFPLIFAMIPGSVVSHGWSL
jgi:hypothetical protein